MSSAFTGALETARAGGHELEHDPPHALASVDRYTCKRCGRAVLGNYGHAYGSAAEGPCPKAAQPPMEETNR